MVSISLTHFKALRSHPLFSYGINVLKFLFVVGVFSLAALFLYRIFHSYSAEDIERSIALISTKQLLLAALFTALCYFILTGYDWIALEHIGKRLPYRKVALASFVSYAFSHSLGFALITSSSTRYRIYSFAGLSPADITRVILLCWATFTLGYTVLTGISFLLEPQGVLEALHALPLPFAISPAYFKIIGTVILLTLVAYLALNLRHRTAPLTIWGWELPLPGVKITLLQLLVSSLDLVAVSAIFYVLLPAHIDVSFFEFLGIMVLAVVAAIMTHVPGGIGVFEAVILLFLSPYSSSSIDLAGTLIVYRVFFYVIPLILAAALFLAHEFFLMRVALLRFWERTHERFSLRGPRILSVAVSLAGAWLLFVNAVPPDSTKLSLLKDHLSVFVIDALYIATSCIGVGLLLLGQGLSHRLRRAYQMSQSLLIAGAFCVLLKGLHTKEALLLSFVLFLHFPFQHNFYRRLPLFGLRYTRGWFLTIFVLFIASMWIGFFYFKHLEKIATHTTIWFDWDRHSEAVRFWRASLCAGLLACVVFMLTSSKRLAPNLYLPKALTSDFLTQHVASFPDHRASLAYARDKALLFSDDHLAFLMCAPTARCWVGLGDPIGGSYAARDVIWKFRELCESTNRFPLFIGTSDACLSLYLDIGLTSFVVAEEAWISLPSFSHDSLKEHLRQSYHEAERKGVTFEVHDASSLDMIFPSLLTLSSHALAVKEGKPHRFVGGRCESSFLSHTPLGVLRLNGSIVAFANVLVSGNRTVAALDQAYISPDVPGYFMDYLLLRFIEWAHSNAFKHFSLGLAPTASDSSTSAVTWWEQLGRSLFHLGVPFHHFSDLRYYLESFSPSWRSLSVSLPSALPLSTAIRDLHTLTHQGWNFEFPKRIRRSVELHSNITKI